jgi:hypothetical protein
MIRRLRFLAACFAVLGLVLTGNPSFAQSKSKGKGQDSTEKKDNPSREKQHKHFAGKDLVGANIRNDGHHKFHENGRFSAFVNVSKGKITGVNVKHSEKGDVPVTKYKTTKQMAEGPTSGIQLASFVLAQAQYVGTIWIGYAYIDDWGDEIIYWFPYDMIFDGDTGAIEYYPAS